jgi:hypothetical protein
MMKALVTRRGGGLYRLKPGSGNLLALRHMQGLEKLMQEMAVVEGVGGGGMSGLSSLEAILNTATIIESIGITPI